METDASVINRDNFTWTNVSIYVDDHYRCRLSPDTDILEPGRKVVVISWLCGDESGAANFIDTFSRVTIKTNQGSSTYVRQ